MSSSSTVLASISTGLNIIGAIILVSALLPPFIETYKSKKTYGVGDKFFLFYSLGGCFMLINAIIGCATISDVATRIMFGTFILVNMISIPLNTYIYKMKRHNMAMAAEKGMSEQDYYETVVKPTLNTGVEE